mmetsp:Transcript_9563/g.17637  ORF Transcript_9563/g.17637 Transcript_9563/m.17637 type:complete len:655 (-) Transcript_9563:58-2022(-)
MKPAGRAGLGAQKATFSFAPERRSTFAGPLSSRKDQATRQADDKFFVSKFHRELLEEQIAGILRKCRPNAPPNIALQVPALARRIEATLYQNATSRKEYANRFTLESRIKVIASQLTNARAKRQRQTPQNSSCDLTKLHSNHIKRAMLDPEEAFESQYRPDIVARVSVEGKKVVAFSFSTDNPALATSTVPTSDRDLADKLRKSIRHSGFSSEEDEGDDEEDQLDDEDHSDASWDDDIEEESDALLENEDEDEDEDDMRMGNTLTGNNDDRFVAPARPGRSTMVETENSFHVSSYEKLPTNSYETTWVTNAGSHIQENKHYSGDLSLQALNRSIDSLLAVNTDLRVAKVLLEDIKKHYLLYAKSPTTQKKACEAFACGILTAIEQIRESQLDSGYVDVFADNTTALASLVSEEAECNVRATGHTTEPSRSMNLSSMPLRRDSLQVPDTKQVSQQMHTVDEGDESLQPLSVLLEFLTSDVISCTPDRDLLRAVLCLVVEPELDAYTSVADRRVLCLCIDKFVESNPKDFAPLVCNWLLKRWPTVLAEKQLLFLAQMESVFRFSDKESISTLFSPVLRQVASSVCHGNWYVANAAMSFGEKLFQYSLSFHQKHQPMSLTVDSLHTALLRATTEHWHPIIRKRAVAISAMISRSMAY